LSTKPEYNVDFSDILLNNGGLCSKS